MSPSVTFIRTVTGNFIRASEIARMRPISIAGRPYTELRSKGGKFLGVIDGAADVAAARIERQASR